MFKTIPIKQCVMFLLERKIKETENLQNEAETFVENYHHEKNNHQVQEFKPKFVLISKQKHQLRKGERRLMTLN